MSGGLTIGEPEPRPLDWAALGLGVLLGVTATFIIGSQNGAEVGKSIEAATRSCVAELGVRNGDSAAACYDMQADALNRIELQRQALDRLADRCVLSVPDTERLRVTRTRDVKRFKVETPAPSSTVGSADWESEDFGPPGDPDGSP
jgi:hypothetical protein